MNIKKQSGFVTLVVLGTMALIIGTSLAYERYKRYQQDKEIHRIAEMVVRDYAD